MGNWLVEAAEDFYERNATQKAFNEELDEFARQTYISNEALEEIAEAIPQKENQLDEEQMEAYLAGLLMGIWSTIHHFPRCPKCQTGLKLEGDYICEDCRYG